MLGITSPSLFFTGLSVISSGSSSPIARFICAAVSADTVVKPNFKFLPFASAKSLQGSDVEKRMYAMLRGKVDAHTKLVDLYKEELDS